MARFSIPVCILATIEVDAESMGIAIDEARNLVEQLSPATEWLDGYNSVSAAHPVTPVRIHAVSQFDCEDIGAEAVEENDVCRTEGCEENAGDGEGWDGYCGNCADRREGE